MEKRKKQYEETLKLREEFKKQSKTLELQEHNPYAYSLENPHTTLVEAKTRSQSVVSTLNLLGSVPYYYKGERNREEIHEVSPDEQERRDREEFKKLFGDTQSTNKGLLVIQTRDAN